MSGISIVTERLVTKRFGFLKYRTDITHHIKVKNSVPVPSFCTSVIMILDVLFAVALLAAITFLLSMAGEERRVHRKVSVTRRVLLEALLTYTCRADQSQFNDKPRSIYTRLYA